MNGVDTMNQAEPYGSDQDVEVGFLDLLAVLSPHWRKLVLGPLLVGVIAFGCTYLISKQYTAKTTFLPPQQSQGGAAAAMASLGALASLVGGGSMKTPADQYVSLMQSASVSDRMIDRYRLLEVYDEKFRVDARKELAKNVQIQIGKKDGLISVEVTDKDPKRSADMANQYVQELQVMTSHLAITEAQQRRTFFENHLKQTRDALTKAQTALQESGFNQGALKSEPKAAAEGYARLRAELTAAEVRLQAMRRAYADGAPELQQQTGLVSALRGQLSRLEQTTDPTGNSDYVTKFREFKYQETLFDLFARQYELARVDESRESTLIQVVDPATPPEKKSKPRRALIAGASALGSFALLVLGLLANHFWRVRATTLTATPRSRA